MRIDLHFDRLAELPFQKALKLFTSTLARTAMDGVTAESYKKRSLQDEKKLGKTLHPVNLRPECMSYEEVDWKPNKENIKEIKIGNYSVVALGDVKATITDTKSNKKCYPKLGIVSDSSNKPVKKIKGHDILWFETYSGATTYHSLVDMKTCEKIWEVEIVLDETLTNPIALNNINIVSKSSYKSCAECWNEDKERCLRLPVTMSLQNRDLPKGKD